MSRFLVGNFDFEHQLATPAHTASRRLQRINAELASSWLAVAEAGDVLWTPEVIADEFWKALADEGLPEVRGSQERRCIPGQVITPWGWSQAARRWPGEPSALELPAIETVRRANSRRLSAELEDEWACGLPFACGLNNVADVAAAIEDCHSTYPGWVIKAEFGMSGRERLLGTGPLTARDQHWIQRRLSQDGVVFFEPWVERVSEVGIQFEIPCQGAVRLLGVAELLPASRGQYAGSIFTGGAGTDSWCTAIPIARKAAERLQSIGYHGPAGIDAMCYRRADGDLAWRPLQDINARWTMGMLALGWRRHFPAARVGYWWHGTTTAFAAGDHLAPLAQRFPGMHATRVIRTSPTIVGTQPCQHAAVVVIADEP